MGIDPSRNHDIQALRARLAAHGQEHVLRFWEGLGAAERASLAAQLGSLDLDGLERALAAARAGGSEAPRKLAPPQVEALPERGGDPARFAEARERGEDLLAEGRVAALVVAGGQATRLGFDGPKGTFPIGPVSRRSLFELQAQKLRRLAARYGRALPWCVMTSAATDLATRAFFADHAYFGLDPADVRFFRQASVPSFDFEGRLQLVTPGRLQENPDGHGGSLPALRASGLLDELGVRGVTTLFYAQVDNPLVRMADPVFLGFHARAGAEMSCKVVRKTDPAEKVGVVAKLDGRVGVVEYSELDDALRLERDPAGDLVYWAGSIGIHVFDLDFVRRVAEAAERWLPYHVASKRIPCLDSAGRLQQPSEPNGLKLERFVFDALAAARRVSVLEAAREAEFSPVKNAHGPDSPETARRALVALYTRWLSAAGVEVPPRAALEIDHARVDDAEDARALGLRNLDDAGDIVRIEPGAHP